jgi:RNA recognition motif-containing protein
VGNLPYSVAWFELKQHMKAVGEVAYANILHDPHGRSKGCGIVEFVSPDLAQKAIATMNDTLIKGRKIFVREDRDTPKSALPPKTTNADGTPVSADGESADATLTTTSTTSTTTSTATTTPATGSGNASSGAPHTTAGTSSEGKTEAAGQELKALSLQDRQLFVKNLAWSTSWQVLKDTFRPIGPVVRADVLRRPDGASRGCGIVLMENAADAKKAVETLNGALIEGRAIVVDYDKKSA